MIPDIDIVINTSAGNQTHDGSTSRVPVHIRAFALRNFILPLLAQTECVNEIFVVGEWESSVDGSFTYIPSPGTHQSCVDALMQRHRGAKATGGSSTYVLFMHDDHIIFPDDLNHFRKLVMQENGKTILVPQRRTRLRYGAGEPLNNGFPEYISGHAALYPQEALVHCPWELVAPVFEWDKDHTAKLLAAGFTFKEAPVPCWDVEQGSTPRL